MEEKHTRFEDLRLMPGQPLQLDFEGYTSERDRSVLIGYRAGQSIIVTTPLVNGSPMVLKLGASLAVRLFATQMNCACAFRTEIIHISRAPYPHLHLAMPGSMVLGEVRSSVRAKVSLIASVHYGENFSQKCSAMIKDLSLGGARLEAKMLPVEVGETIQLTAQVAVSGIERIIKLDAIVRAITKETGGVGVGLQFQTMSDSDRITLHAYVLSNIHRQ
ncbi:flagellar brake protein [Thalassolituus hydrocarboniclasticus]|uniref:Flagellar brake protein n=1 Tax=Thalassolituus hydrocarboniclasticus TaxID=2742796 RepID=A0ABY6A740_9GAMM|nr:flagellar brake protein [Thalassolituus hydrocarboniclasticus]UXD86749.1 flagellar brake protein [Thalassolituus hydrocarboniclasticus]